MNLEDAKQILLMQEQIKAIVDVLEKNGLLEQKTHKPTKAAN